MLRPLDLGRRTYPLLLLLLWATMTLPTLGMVPLFDYDETIYAQTALDMMHQGQWIIPVANGMKFFAKPPFIYYLMALSFKVLGQNAFAARLPSAVFTILTAWILFAAGARLQDSHFGLATAAIFLSTLEVALLAHAAVLEAPLIFFIASSLLAYSLWVKYGQRSMAYAMAAAMGAAVSIKGPVGGVVPLMVMGLDRLWARDIRRCLRQFPWWPCLGLFVLMATPWYLLILIVDGPRFLSNFIWVENIGRVLNPKEMHSGGWYYYLVVFLISALPWTGWLPLYFRRAFGYTDATWQPILRFSVTWVLSVIALFSFVQTKLPHYIASVYPGLALGLATLLFAVKDSSSSRRLIRAVSLLVMLPGSLFFTVLPWIYPALTRLVHNQRSRAIVAQNITVPLFTAIMGGIGLIALLALLRNSRRLTLTSFATRFIILGFWIQTALLVSIGPFAGRLMQTPTMDIANYIRQLPSQMHVYSFNLDAPSVSFYSGRNYQLVKDARVLAEQVKSPSAVFLRTFSAPELAGLNLPPPVYDNGGFLLYVVGGQ